VTIETAELAIDSREFDLFRRLIHSETGIALKDSKRPLLISRLGHRLRTLGLGSFSEYYTLLKTRDRGGEELRQLINSITTNKTSFFREPDHFSFLAMHVRERAKREGDRGRLAVWSSACSTGEEPYTIAMTLREALPEAYGAVEITASDIDTDVLAQAAAGLYPEEALAPVEPDLRRKYFLRGKGQWEGLVKVKPVLQEMVDFRQVNLVEDNWRLEGPYDIIFCRNVVIYFDRETQERLFDRMLNRLRADGLLFVGHSESLQWLSNRVQAVRHTVYRKRPPEHVTSVPPRA
jgi:chemotaxis protein methyltransferase CheR